MSNLACNLAGPELSGRQANPINPDKRGEGVGLFRGRARDMTIKRFRLRQEQ